MTKKTTHKIRKYKTFTKWYKYIKNYKKNDK